tara:strand:+ start:76 stop:759 length:684 start_codon:yes stop_codon:yes gene_type:complete
MAALDYSFLNTMNLGGEMGGGFYGFTPAPTKTAFDTTTKEGQQGYLKNERSKLGLSPSANPDFDYADVAVRQYGRYINDFRPFEEEMLRNRKDTSLVDAVPEDVAQQTQIAEDVARRNRERLGMSETAALRQGREAASQRGEALALTGGLNNARLAQLDANNRTLANLINIGQGVNRSSLTGLGTAAANDVSRQNAFTQARAQHAAQNRQIGGSVLATAAMAAILFA